MSPYGPPRRRTLDQMLASLPVSTRLNLERRYWAMVLAAVIAENDAPNPSIPSRT
jgi:hypothetical protein